MPSTPELLSVVKTLRTNVAETKKKLLSRGDSPRFPLTTLPKLSKMLWGLHPGLTVIGARSSNGKSAFVLQVAYDLAKQGHHVLFVSLEMDETSIVERLFCRVKDVDNTDTRTGGLKREPRLQEKWKEFEKEMDTFPLMITNGVGKTFNELTELVELINPIPKVIIIDYIQAIKQSGGTSREIIDEYIRNFRQYCLENDIVGILCSQNNRQAVAGDTNIPSLHTLKSTGTLEEHSDVVMLLHWENYYTKDPGTYNDYKILVAKNRNGMTGSADVNFFPEYYRFEEQLDEKHIIKTFK